MNLSSHSFINDKKYPQWIGEFSKSVHQAFFNMAPNSFGPLDTFSLLKYLDGRLTNKIHEALKVLEEKNISIEEVAQSFPSVSSLRCSIFYVAKEWMMGTHKNKEETRTVLEYLVKMLESRTYSDTFAHRSNITHTPDAVKKMLSETKWNAGDPTIARELGKLYNSFFSLSYALYRDFFPQETNEICGPYDPKSHFPGSSIFLMKEFPKIKPVSLWPDMADFPYTHMRMLQVYDNVGFVCELIGSHAIYNGDVINDLRAWAVFIDGKAESDVKVIKEVTDVVAEYATKQAVVYDDFSLDDLKLITLKWLLYEFFDLFKLAGLDWRPTQEMIDAVKGEKIPERSYYDSFPSFDEYATSKEFEVYWLKELYK